MAPTFLISFLILSRKRMPKRNDLKKVLIIGAGPIIIGQACEFDYSGVQACKALLEEGLEVILLNSNPATIMTDPELATRTYIEPITWQVLAKIIDHERPDAVLPTMGGQTALNCALELAERGILAQYGIELIGANLKAIRTAEDRELFKNAMGEIGLESPRSVVVRSMQEAIAAQSELGFPMIVRPSFTLGGSGGGIAYNREEFVEICESGLEISPTHELLLDESLIGWKEFELEVVRDKNDNGIVICSIENIDPLGIHTGDSITVAPALTLTDKEYQNMRNAALAVLRKVGVETGGANVQFGVHPQTGRMVVIEMNPRVSRSSALASKATGFPIAKIAAKLAIGYTLDELGNEITGGVIPASFEPTFDYVVTKIPRFAFEKFPAADPTLTTQMKSVGETMAIGRTFKESLQKALRSLEIGVDGFDEHTTDSVRIEKELAKAGPKRLWYVADAFRKGMTLENIHGLTNIDPWFLSQIQEIVMAEHALLGERLSDIDQDYLWALKRDGFSDRRLARLMNTDEESVRSYRWALGVHPVYKRVDTCAAEFTAATAYLYSCYEEECEAMPSDAQKVMVLGGGPNRIGQGIEFDYCCVHAAMAASELGYETIMVNCNPETVSTDYDISDRLYFEPVTLEDVLEIWRKENPKGVIVQYGGQTPLRLTLSLAKAGVPILGTDPQAIDNAEDRERFSQIMEQCGLLQPPNRTARTVEEAFAAAKELGYPLMVRPSYVLGGRAMEIVYAEEDLAYYIKEAVRVAEDTPILLDRFLDHAIEIDVDAASDGETVFVAGIMEHVEEAGVHSGDSACSLPPFSLSAVMQENLRQQTKLLAKTLGVVGLMNVQFAIQDDIIYVLEVNPRASRTVPFVSKALGIPLAKIAAKAMLGVPIVPIPCQVPYFSVKEAVFPFAKFSHVDPILGPEMKSTGEVMGIGRTFAEAFVKSQWASGIILPTSGTVFISVKDRDKPRISELASILHNLQFKVVATDNTAKCLQEAGIPATRVNKVVQGRPHIVDMIKNGDIDLIINTTEGKQAIEDSYEIRQAALQYRVTYYTTIAGARAFCAGLLHKGKMEIKALQDWHQLIERNL